MLAEFGTGQVFWSLLWFYVMFLWIWFVVRIFSDIFRSDDLSEWGKTAWTFFVIFLPFLGCFAYLIARGRSMTDRAIDEANRRDAAFRGYVQEVVATTPAPASNAEVDQISRLAALHDTGVIDDEEFRRMKARVLPV